MKLLLTPLPLDLKGLQEWKEMAVGEGLLMVLNSPSIRGGQSVQLTPRLEGAHENTTSFFFSHRADCCWGLYGTLGSLTQGRSPVVQYHIPPQCGLQCQSSTVNVFRSFTP